MMKIDRETCPPGTRLLVRVKGLPRLFDWQIVQWASTVEAVKVVKDVGHIRQWLPLVNGQIDDSEALEILPADPAVPVPGPWDSGWKDVWPSEIPDGSVWEYESKVWGAVRFVAMDGELGNPNEDVWLCQGAFNLETDNRIRRVG